jgi:F-type H+-transporting ATPase subunit delta
VIVRRFARPYAKAIIGAAGSAENASKVRGELMPFATTLRNSLELQEVYSNPGIDLDSKLAITKRVAGKLKVSELGEKVLEVLVRNHRINDIDSVLAAVAAYTNGMLGIAVAEVRSAKSLTPEEMDQLADVLGKKVGKRVELDVRTDPSLLAGFIAKIGSEIYDASVLRKIDRFRESLA